MAGRDWDVIWRELPHRMHRWPAEPLVRWAAHLPQGCRVLEVGCGNGANLWFLAWEGFDCAGCDISQSALDHAAVLLEEHRRPGSPLECDLRRGSATDLPFADAGFDAVCDVQCFQHLSVADLGRAYTEVARVLVAEGRFFSMHLDPAVSDVAALFPDVGDVVPFDRQLLAAAGLGAGTVDSIVRTTGSLTARWDLVAASKSSGSRPGD